jgi:murein DD-endopeptidase MepM/ murein hydrolase activator NlpD
MTPNLTTGVNDKLRQLADATGDRAVDQDTVRRLAQEFESLLMSQMIRDMRKSMLDDEESEEGFGADALMDTGVAELGRALSAGGGFGLADALLGVLEKQIVTPASEAHTASLTTPATASAIVAEPSQAPATSTRVNSTFGWRMDPISGRPRFHNGIDIAAAYGSNVESAGAGRVAFAGVQGTYGDTIVIDHGDGRQTRYAHLSDRLVKTGDAVQAGQVIGRAGQSGRSTGPHLHFEMLVNGRPVDPQAQVAAALDARGVLTKGLAKAVD